MSVLALARRRRWGWTGVLGAAGVLACAPTAVAPAARVDHHQSVLRVGTPRTVRLVAGDAAAGVALRIRVPRCARRAPLRLAVTVDGSPVGTGHPRPSRWRALRFAHALPRGRHVVRLALEGGSRRCRRSAVDVVGLLPAPAPGPDTPSPVGPVRSIPLAAAVDERLAARLDRRYDQAFLGHFDGLTPENAMKMPYVEVEPHKFDFLAPDALVAYANFAGRTVRGHPLLWNDQIPGWLRSERWTPDEARALVKEWVTTMVSHYAARGVHEWDVVNEPLAADGTLRPGFFLSRLGPGYIADAFRWARAADPTARLFLNEYDVEVPGPKQDALVALVRDLRAAGVPLDGVGIQAHWTLGRLPHEHDVYDALLRLAGLGMRVEITEADVAIDGRPGAAQRQADAFAALARACQAVPECDRFTVWGVSDRDSWRGPGSAPLLLDASYREKPAYAAVRAALAGRR